MERATVFTLAIIAFAWLTTSATVINIPDDYPTIQEGIDASIDGDTVLVQPGTYVETVNFNGHNILLCSMFLPTGDTSYISQTVIERDSVGTSGVTIEYCTNDITSIIGFTIRGTLNYPRGRGIYCINSNLAIRNNIIRDNWNMDRGGGICSYESNVSIIGNRIEHNVVDGQSSWGGGIFVSGGSVEMYNNTVCFNSAEFWNPRDPIWEGGGLYFSEADVTLFNNVIAYNDGSPPDIYVHENCDTFLMINSIVWNYYGSTMSIRIQNPTIIYCDIQDTLWPGEGNMSIDPLFRDPDNDDFHLMFTQCGDLYDSPCIDAGDPAILDSLLDCNWGLGWYRSDMGAYGGGDSAQVGIDWQQPQLPGQFALSQNYPNPFNASTTIEYALPQEAGVTIEIYDILGREVETLMEGRKAAGQHSLVWQADNVSSGVYFYRIEAGDYTQARRCLLLK